MTAPTGKATARPAANGPRVVILAGDTGLGWAGKAGWSSDSHAWATYPGTTPENGVSDDLARATKAAQRHAGPHPIVVSQAPAV